MWELTNHSQSSRQAGVLLLKVTEYSGSDFYEIIKLTSDPWWHDTVNGWWESHTSKRMGYCCGFLNFMLCAICKTLVYFYFMCVCRGAHVCEQTRRGQRSTLRAVPQEPSTSLFETGSLSPWSSPSKLRWPTKESWGSACLHPHSAGATNAHHDVRLFDIGSRVQTWVLMLARQTLY